MHLGCSKICTKRQRICIAARYADIESTVGSNKIRYTRLAIVCGYGVAVAECSVRGWVGKRIPARHTSLAVHQAGARNPCAALPTPERLVPAIVVYCSLSLGRGCIG